MSNDSRDGGSYNRIVELLGLREPRTLVKQLSGRWGHTQRKRVGKCADGYELGANDSYY